MIIDFKNLRPLATYPIYPPYHQGDYMEEYFYKYYIKNKAEFDKTRYTLIPIFWTNVYITQTNINLIQYYLDSLPQDGKYFTVSQHDDAVREILPKNTISFEAGGNANGIPLPLICSPLSEDVKQFTDKDIFCSFVGSITHSIRSKIHQQYSTDSDFFLIGKNWTPSVSKNDFNEFIDITKRSRFTLCPRGYGAQSFRLYEVLQLNSVPVIIYDKKWFPFNDEIDWNSFCVLVHENEINNLKAKLINITDENYNKMIEVGKQIYSKYFTMEGMATTILNNLKSLKR